MKYQSLLLLLLTLSQLQAQTITIQPYLQDGSPNSIHILWETDSQEESTVEYGLTAALGSTATGIAYTSSNAYNIHEVKLENLQRFTTYYYRVKTGAAISAIHHFKTPPFASDHQPFRMIAMSDMQVDESHPDKFREIVEDGIIPYIEQQLGGALTDELALVLIPGDLVDDGLSFTQWHENFFLPAEKLFSQVPLYPVLGNHEANSPFYFSYFKLPENGAVSMIEHCWWKDYGNTRIIGLNSNNPFANADQLSWLDEVLSETCAADSIDFVFAALHHPHKSELWTPGESDFTGEVIQRLEQMTNDCGKPGIHFFGHTHGYSRGQSRDHKHLWINVATAGGAIDNWGEFPNFDYDEFSVSRDDYGFVVVEVSDDGDPKLVIKRISRGDQDMITNNTLTDSLVLRVSGADVATPQAVFPINEEVAPECVTLKGTAYASNNPNTTHGQSHWQVASIQSGFDQPVAESWKNYENWYNEADTQAGDDLTDESIFDLAENSSYWWRVRYRDREMNWSDWSIPVAFSTGASVTSSNLLLNPGAEDSLQHWTPVEGVVEALTSFVCEGINCHSGERYFIVGGLCEHSPVGRCVQNVDVSTYADSIDAGVLQANFGGYLSNYNGSDLPEMRLLFLDENESEISVSNTLSTLNSSWTFFSEWVLIPPQTRFIQMELKGTRNAGTDNDSYFDDLFLKVAPTMIDCSNFVSGVTIPVMNIPEFMVVPNPVGGEAYIALPENLKVDGLRLQVVDTFGNKVFPVLRYEPGRIVLESGGMGAGAYFFMVRSGDGVVGRGEFVVQ
jgi:Calcineurin-like phosphoesterase/Purple acid Phosphatase, N-terminal domain